jgi:8-oxo-dGTP pyrophosphatase MutT (NUDIX family)
VKIKNPLIIALVPIVFIFNNIMDGEKRKVIQAGGGLVENEKGEVLLMFRRGKWDLPKGKLDPGESLANCAIREVEEETGIRVQELQKFLLITKHNYHDRGAELIKETHWWLMKANSRQALIPQTAEDITELKWFAPSELSVVLQNTYPGIIEVLKAGKLYGM